MSKLNTVNVIELDSQHDPASLQSLTAFEDNEEGNKEAEALFKAIVKKLLPDLTEEEIESCVEQGWCETDSEHTPELGGVYLVHSRFFPAEDIIA